MFIFYLSDAPPLECELHMTRLGLLYFESAETSSVPEPGGPPCVLGEQGVLCICTIVGYLGEKLKAKLHS